MAPLVTKLLAGKNRPAPAEYKAADFTSYASLRAALDGVEGPVCLTSEGTLAYLTQSEVRQLCANVRRVLREFGGRWLTPDPEAGKRTIGTLRAVMGEEAVKNMMSAFNTLSAQSDVTVGDNDLVMRLGKADGFEKAAGAMDLTGVHVDMSELAYISSAGLRVLLMMIKAVQPGHVVLSGVNGTVRDILAQTGYADMVTVE